MGALLVSWLVFPLVLGGVSLGCGLLLERASGARLPAALLLPSGVAVVIVVGQLTTLADYFVICSGGSERQLDAIGDGIVETLRDERVRPIGREGTSASHWILVDYGSVVVHVFTPPERDFYQLERHWGEAKTILRVQ